MTTIKSLCEEFNFDPSKMTKEQKIVIKLMTHWTEAKINQKLKPLEVTIKNQKKKIQSLEKIVGNFKKPTPGDADFKYPKKGKIFITEYKDVILITGNTYEVRPIIKSYEKPKWQKDLGGWSLSKENNVEEIVKELEPLVKSIQIAKSEKILLTEDSD